MGDAPTTDACYSVVAVVALCTVVAGLISLSAKERRTRWPRPIRGCTVYDALFVALAETKSEERPALVSSDERLMRSLEGTSYAGLVLALSKVGELLLFRVAP